MYNFRLLFVLAPRFSYFSLENRKQKTYKNKRKRIKGFPRKAVGTVFHDRYIFFFFYYLTSRRVGSHLLRWLLWLWFHDFSLPFLLINTRGWKTEENKRRRGEGYRAERQREKEQIQKHGEELRRLEKHSDRKEK